MVVCVIVCVVVTKCADTTVAVVKRRKRRIPAAHDATEANVLSVSSDDYAASSANISSSSSSDEDNSDADWRQQQEMSDHGHSSVFRIPTSAPQSGPTNMDSPGGSLPEPSSSQKLHLGRCSLDVGETMNNLEGGLLPSESVRQSSETENPTEAVSELKVLAMETISSPKLVQSPMLVVATSASSENSVTSLTTVTSSHPQEVLLMSDDGVSSENDRVDGFPVPDDASFPFCAASLQSSRSTADVESDDTFLLQRRTLRTASCDLVLGNSSAAEDSAESDFTPSHNNTLHCGAQLGRGGGDNEDDVSVELKRSVFEHTEPRAEYDSQTDIYWNVSEKSSLRPHESHSLDDDAGLLTLDDYVYVETASAADVQPCRQLAVSCPVEDGQEIRDHIEGPFPEFLHIRSGEVTGVDKRNDFDFDASANCSGIDHLVAATFEEDFFDEIVCSRDRESVRKAVVSSHDVQLQEAALSIESSFQFENGQTDHSDLHSRPRSHSVGHCQTNLTPLTPCGRSSSWSTMPLFLQRYTDAGVVQEDVVSFACNIDCMDELLFPGSSSSISSTSDKACYLEADFDSGNVFCPVHLGPDAAQQSATNESSEILSLSCDKSHSMKDGSVPGDKFFVNCETIVSDSDESFIECESIVHDDKLVVSSDSQNDDRHLHTSKTGEAAAGSENVLQRATIEVESRISGGDSLSTNTADDAHDDVMLSDTLTANADLFSDQLALSFESLGVTVLGGQGGSDDVATGDDDEVDDTEVCRMPADGNFGENFVKKGSSSMLLADSPLLVATAQVMHTCDAHEFDEQLLGNSALCNTTSLSWTTEDNQHGILLQSANFIEENSSSPVHLASAYVMGHVGGPCSANGDVYTHPCAEIGERDVDHNEKTPASVPEQYSSKLCIGNVSPTDGLPALATYTPSESAVSSNLLCVTPIGSEESLSNNQLTNSELELPAYSRLENEAEACEPFAISVLRNLAFGENADHLKETTSSNEKVIVGFDRCVMTGSAVSDVAVYQPCNSYESDKLCISVAESSADSSGLDEPNILVLRPALAVDSSVLDEDESAFHRYASCESDVISDDHSKTGDGKSRGSCEELVILEDCALFESTVVDGESFFGSLLSSVVESHPKENKAVELIECEMKDGVHSSSDLRTAVVDDSYAARSAPSSTSAREMLYVGSHESEGLVMPEGNAVMEMTGTISEIDIVSMQKEVFPLVEMRIHDVARVNEKLCSQSELNISHNDEEAASGELLVNDDVAALPLLPVTINVVDSSPMEYGCNCSIRPEQQVNISEQTMPFVATESTLEFTATQSLVYEVCGQLLQKTLPHDDVVAVHTDCGLVNIVVDGQQMHRELSESDMLVDSSDSSSTLSLNGTSHKYTADLEPPVTNESVVYYCCSDVDSETNALFEHTDTWHSDTSLRIIAQPQETDRQEEQEVKLDTECQHEESAVEFQTACRNFHGAGENDQLLRSIELHAAADGGLQAPSPDVCPTDVEGTTSNVAAVKLDTDRSVILDLVSDAVDEQKHHAAGVVQGHEYRVEADEVQRSLVYNSLVMTVLPDSSDPDVALVVGAELLCTDTSDVGSDVFLTASGTDCAVGGCEIVNVVDSGRITPVTFASEINVSDMQVSSLTNFAGDGADLMYESIKDEAENLDWHGNVGFAYACAETSSTVNESLAADFHRAIIWETKPVFEVVTDSDSKIPFSDVSVHTESLCKINAGIVRNELSDSSEEVCSYVQPDQAVSHPSHVEQVRAGDRLTSGDDRSICRSTPSRQPVQSIVPAGRFLEPVKSTDGKGRSSGVLTAKKTAGELTDTEVLGIDLVPEKRHDSMESLPRQSSDVEIVMSGHSTIGLGGRTDSEYQSIGLQPIGTHRPQFTRGPEQVLRDEVIEQYPASFWHSALDVEFSPRNRGDFREIANGEQITILPCDSTYTAAAAAVQHNAADVSDTVVHRQSENSVVVVERSHNSDLLRDANVSTSTEAVAQQAIVFGMSSVFGDENLLETLHSVPNSKHKPCHVTELGAPVSRISQQYPALTNAAKTNQIYDLGVGLFRSKSIGCLDFGVDHAEPQLVRAHSDVSIKCPRRSCSHRRRHRHSQPMSANSSLSKSDQELLGSTSVLFEDLLPNFKDLPLCSSFDDIDLEPSDDRMITSEFGHFDNVVPCGYMNLPSLPGSSAASSDMEHCGYGDVVTFSRPDITGRTSYPGDVSTGSLYPTPCSVMTDEECQSFMIAADYSGSCSDVADNETSDDVVDGTQSMDSITYVFVGRGASSLEAVGDNRAGMERFSSEPSSFVYGDSVDVQHHGHVQRRKYGLLAETSSDSCLLSTDTDCPTPTRRSLSCVDWNADSGGFSDGFSSDTYTGGRKVSTSSYCSEFMHDEFDAETLNGMTELKDEAQADSDHNEIAVQTNECLNAREPLLFVSAVRKEQLEAEIQSYQNHILRQDATKNVNRIFSGRDVSGEIGQSSVRDDRPGSTLSAHSGGKVQLETMDLSANLAVPCNVYDVHPGNTCLQSKDHLKADSGRQLPSSGNSQNCEVMKKNYAMQNLTHDGVSVKTHSTQSLPCSVSAQGLLPVEHISSSSSCRTIETQTYPKMRVIETQTPNEWETCGTQTARWNGVENGAEITNLNVPLAMSDSASNPELHTLPTSAPNIELLLPSPGVVCSQFFRSSAISSPTASTSCSVNQNDSCPVTADLVHSCISAVDRSLTTASHSASLLSQEPRIPAADADNLQLRYPHGIRSCTNVYSALSVHHTAGNDDRLVNAAGFLKSASFLDSVDAAPSDSNVSHGVITADHPDLHRIGNRLSDSSTMQSLSSPFNSDLSRGPRSQWNMTQKHRKEGMLDTDAILEKYRMKRTASDERIVGVANASSSLSSQIDNSVHLSHPFTCLHSHASSYSHAYDSGIVDSQRSLSPLTRTLFGCDKSTITDDSGAPSTGQLERLQKERQRIIDVLSHEVIPSRIQVQLMEAHLNYLIGETDALLQHVDEPLDLPRRDVLGSDFHTFCRDRLEASKRHIESQILQLERVERETHTNAARLSPNLDSLVQNSNLIRERRYSADTPVCRACSSTMSPSERERYLLDIRREIVSATSSQPVPPTSRGDMWHSHNFRRSCLSRGLCSPHSSFLNLGPGGSIPEEEPECFASAAPARSLPHLNCRQYSILSSSVDDEINSLLRECQEARQRARIEIGRAMDTIRRTSPAWSSSPVSSKRYHLFSFAESV